jgi:hypothetical protein
MKPKLIADELARLVAEMDQSGNASTDRAILIDLGALCSNNAYEMIAALNLWEKQGIGTRRGLVREAKAKA